MLKLYNRLCTFLYISLNNYSVDEKGEKKESSAKRGFSESISYIKSFVCRLQFLLVTHLFLIC